MKFYQQFFCLKMLEGEGRILCFNLRYMFEPKYKQKWFHSNIFSEGISNHLFPPTAAAAEQAFTFGPEKRIHFLLGKGFAPAYVQKFWGTFCVKILKVQFCFSTICISFFAQFYKLFWRPLWDQCCLFFWKMFDNYAWVALFWLQKEIRWSKSDSIGLKGSWELINSTIVLDQSALAPLSFFFPNQSIFKGVYLFQRRWRRRRVITLVFFSFSHTLFVVSWRKRAKQKVN